MGWSCTKHEWDEGSDNWEACAEQVAGEIKHLAGAPHSRPLSPCPECVRELLAARDAEIKRLRKALVDIVALDIVGESKKAGTFARNALENAPGFKESIYFLPPGTK